MKIGANMIFNHVTPPAFVAQAAELVEAAGFHSIWVPEHVVFFPEYQSRYPYTADGKIPGEPDGILDPFSALTFIAAVTSRIRLGTGVCLVPQRNPVYTARAVADLDYLSGGRLDFGVGIGWLKEEFENLQLDFSTRARRTVEYIEVMRALWAPGVSAYSGESYELRACYSNPKPVQQPHPPIYFGGETDAAMRRVASHGNGWFGFNRDPEAARDGIARLQERLREAGRSRSDIQVFIGSNFHPVTRETVPRYEDAGTDQLIVPLRAGNIDKLKTRIDEMLRVVPL